MPRPARAGRHPHGDVERGARRRPQPRGGTERESRSSRGPSRARACERERRRCAADTRVSSRQASGQVTASAALPACGARPRRSTERRAKTLASPIRRTSTTSRVPSAIRAWSAGATAAPGRRRLPVGGKARPRAPRRAPRQAQERREVERHVHRDAVAVGDADRHRVDADEAGLGRPGERDVVVAVARRGREGRSGDAVLGAARDRRGHRVAVLVEAAEADDAGAPAVVRPSAVAQPRPVVQRGASAFGIAIRVSARPAVGGGDDRERIELARAVGGAVDGVDPALRAPVVVRAARRRRTSSARRGRAVVPRLTVSGSWSASEQTTPKRRVAPGPGVDRDVAAARGRRSRGWACRSASRSTSGPIWTVSGVSAERAPRSSVAQKVVDSSPRAVAVR